MKDPVPGSIAEWLLLLAPWLPAPAALPEAWAGLSSAQAPGLRGTWLPVQRSGWVPVWPERSVKVRRRQPAVPSKDPTGGRPQEERLRSGGRLNWSGKVGSASYIAPEQ